jgi:hypothetical protein
MAKHLQANSNTIDVSEAILMPLGRVVTFVLAGSTKSGSDGGRVMPGRGTSRVGSWVCFPPRSQLNKPPEDCFTTLVLANLLEPCCCKHKNGMIK